MVSNILVILAIVISYLIGSIPTSFLFGKFIGKIDIRDYGSGNVGATNAYRVLGKIPGVLVLIIDILKGFVVAGLLADLFYKIKLIDIDYDSLKTLMGLFAIIGHIWNVFLRFKGGKGIATTIGVLLAISPKLTALLLVTWLVIFLPFRYVSFASVVSIVILPIVTVIISKPLPIAIFTITICIISTYKHIPNLKRLVRGEEHKFGNPLEEKKVKTI